MIIIGIDPGTTSIGFGVIKKDKAKLSMISCGVIKNSGNDKIQDYKNTSTQLALLIKKNQPDLAAVEKLFFFKNQKTVISVSEMRGIIMLTLSRQGIPIYEFTPLQVKQAVSGYGRAEKNQVQDFCGVG